MRRIISVFFLASLLLPTVSYGQTFNPYYASIVANCEYDSVDTYLNDFTNFGVKELGTSALDNTKDWIISKYNEWGYTDIVEDPFSYSGMTTENIIVTKQGSVYPNTYLIIDGHYDTKNGVGSNDNGSGTAIILEMARIFKDIETEYSIKFIHFSGEEDGLIGSQHYVDNTVVPDNLDILLVYNIDEVGGISGMVNDVIVCERDESPPTASNGASDAMTSILAGCIELYSSLDTEISYAYASDYMPFQDNGEVITGLYEKNESPYAHTALDNMSNLDVPYIFEVAKGGLGAALEFAIPIESGAGLVESDVLQISAVPNPSSGVFKLLSNYPLTETVKISVTDLLGKCVLQITEPSLTNGLQIDLSKQTSGSYFLSVETSQLKKTTKIIVNQ